MIRRRVNRGAKPTYEELKRWEARKHFKGEPCAKPTYEELKRIYDVSVYFEHYGAKPTYEELKPL